jgi:hypothetical protein
MTSGSSQGDAVRITCDIEGAVTLSCQISRCLTTLVPQAPQTRYLAPFSLVRAV